MIIKKGWINMAGILAGLAMAVSSPLFSQTLPFGTGRDGSVAIVNGNLLTTAYATGRMAPDSEMFPVSALGSDVITIGGAGTGGTRPSVLAQSIRAGDQVLLIKMRGSQSTTASVGIYEYLWVRAVIGNRLLVSPITGMYGITTNAMIANERIAVIRVPQYTNVSITGTLTTLPWNGNTGGLIVFKASGTLTLSAGAAINATSMGYRGGQRLDGGYWRYGQAGESIGGDAIMVTNAFTNANFGGGGGGIAYQVSTGTGGGGGGYGTAGGTASSGGAGGSIIGVSNLSKVLLGSGGGSGGEDTREPNSYAGPGYLGGRGGGAIMIAADTVNLSGSIVANGEAGESTGSLNGFDGGGGGGGSGGSILVIANNWTGNPTITAAGGAAGTTDGGAARNGAAGGNGRMAVYTSTAITLSNADVVRTTPLSAVPVAEPATLPTDTDGDGIPDTIDGASTEFNKAVDYVTHSSLSSLSADAQSSLKLWLRSGDDYFVRDASNKIAMWYDWSGNRNHFIQADVAFRPQGLVAISGLGSLDFPANSTTFLESDQLINFNWGNQSVMGVVTFSGPQSASDVATDCGLTTIPSGASLYANGADCVMIFSKVGMTTWAPPSWMNTVDVLVVAHSLTSTQLV